MVQSGEGSTTEPTGSKRRVRASSRARYLLLARMACDQWHRSRHRPEEVSERAGPCLALKDALNVRLTSAIESDFPNRAVEVRTCATRTA